MLLFKRNGIGLSKCRAQAYDGTYAMSSEASGAASVIKNVQPLAECTHCRSHILNLAISCACRNQSIKTFMDNLTSVCNFPENSPKRQKYFECFLGFYKTDLNLPETKLEIHIICYTKQQFSLFTVFTTVLTKTGLGMQNLK